MNLEIMLEFFDQEINQVGIIQIASSSLQFDRRVRRLLRAIDNAEKLVTLRMMLTRNGLMYYELAGTIMTAFLSVGSCISG